MKRWIYIVKWEYVGGGGFDWYWNIADAVSSLMREQTNMLEFADSQWTAALIPMPAPDDVNMGDGDAATKAISEYIQSMSL